MITSLEVQGSSQHVAQSIFEEIDLLDFKVSLESSPQKLVKYRTDLFRIREQIHGKPVSLDVTHKIDALDVVISKRCLSEMRNIIEQFSSSDIFKKAVSIRYMLFRAFGEEEIEIYSFIKKLPVTFGRGEIFTGKSIQYPFQTTSGKQIVVKYRLYGNKPQILVSQKLQEGTFEIVEKTVVVYGEALKNAPNPVFARLKLKDAWKNNNQVITETRNASLLSQYLYRKRVYSIVQYTILSQRKNGATLAAKLYKEDFYTYLRRGPFNPETQKLSKILYDIAIPIARALCGLHENNYVHLDLKPENILLTEQGKAFLGDLGSCKEIFSLYNTAITPFHVAAPETFTEQNIGRVDPSSDMWAFGLLLASLFLGLSQGRVTVLDEKTFSEFSLDKKRSVIIQGSEKIKEKCSKASQEGYIHPRISALICKLLDTSSSDRPIARSVLHELQEFVKTNR